MVSSPPEQQSSLSHPKIPSERPGGELFFANALAIIVNFQGQIAVLFGESHVYLGRVRVPRHIGQGLLEDAKQCRGAIF